MNDKGYVDDASDPRVIEYYRDEHDKAKAGSIHQITGNPTFSLPIKPITSPAATIISMTNSSDYIECKRGGITCMEVVEESMLPSTVSPLIWKRASLNTKSTLPRSAR